MKLRYSLTAVVLPFVLLSAVNAQPAQIQINATQKANSVSPYLGTGACLEDVNHEGDTHGALPRLQGRPRSAPLEGSRFCPDPVCTLILETPHLLGGRVLAGGSRERFLTPLQPTAIHFVSYPCIMISETTSWDVSGSRLLDNVSEI